MMQKMAGLCERRRVCLMAKRLGPPAERLAQRLATGCGEGGAEVSQRFPLAGGPIYSWFAEVRTPSVEGAAEVS